jgi:L-amino acid N-acyltransferase YncA
VIFLLSGQVFKGCDGKSRRGTDPDATPALHRRLGFEQVAHLREVGRKFDRWPDLVFMQRLL